MSNLENNSQLVTRNNSLPMASVNQIYEVGKYVKKIKEKHDKTSDQMEEFLNENTQDERRELEAAMAKFNRKMESLVKSDKYKEMEDKLDKYEEKLQVTMTQVMISYKKAIKQIYHTYQNEQDRHQKMIQFHKVIEDAFLSEDQKQILTTIKSEIKALPRKVIHL